MSLKIAHVEDDASIRKLLSILLKIDGHSLASYGDPEEFFNCVNENGSFHDYHAIFTDLNMPKMSGSAFAIKLREQGYKGLIVLLSNGLGLNEEELALFSYQLKKPFEPAELFGLIETIQSQYPTSQA
jgi:DNA-binding response OmpR family regulator